MIEKMKFITLTGPENDLDRVVDQYLSRYEIHLENALRELPDEKRVTPFQGANPYRDMLSRIRSYTDLIPEKDRGAIARSSEDTEEDPAGLASLLETIGGRLAESREEKKALEDKSKQLADTMKALEPFRNLPEHLERILTYHYVDFRFGKIPKDYFEKFKNYVYDNFVTVFFRTKSDEQYVYGIYFAPEKEMHMIDAVYASMHFERIFIPDGYTGTPGQVYDQLAKESASAADQIRALTDGMLTSLEKDAPQLLAAERRLENMSANYEIRREAGCIRHKDGNYYILCGWMAAGDTDRFQKELDSDAKVVCVVEDSAASGETPPTKLRNPKFFKPYEMYIEMYGLPNYREIDPTIFVAISYSFIFGAMFGDWGQGLVLLIGGALLYRFRHIRLAGIISCAGIFSTFFGMMFGSFFGFEDTIIHHIWLKPKEQTMNLPGVGTINSVLVYAIVFGMFLILTTMVFNIINSHRLHDREAELFGTNSLAGFLFYVGVVIAVFTAFGSSHRKIGFAFILVFFILPLAAMFCKEPLGRLVAKDHSKPEEGVGMFIIQSFFEMFETLLSFFSNTLSFVRIGAFAVSHAAMMEVVLMLAGAANGGTPNWIAVILGNAFVMGMEGLIVGIQVLRLEYYEMFSRFYRGDGRPFVPFRKEKQKSA